MQVFHGVAGHLWKSLKNQLRSTMIRFGNCLASVASGGSSHHGMAKVENNTGRGRMSRTHRTSGIRHDVDAEHYGRANEFRRTRTSDNAQSGQRESRATHIGSGRRDEAHGYHLAGTRRVSCARRATEERECANYPAVAARTGVEG